MRLSLFLCLLPSLLIAQSNDYSFGDSQNIFERIRLRAGISLQFDSNTDEYYVERIHDLVPYYPRKNFLSGVVDCTPIGHSSGFRTQFRLAYSNVKFMGNNQRLGNSFFGPGFQENIDYHHLQTAMGLYVEPFPRHLFSPYFSSHILLSIPLSMRYEATRESTLNSPLLVEVKGGAKASPGWESGMGVRAHIGDRWSANLGAYYTQQDILVDWPDITGRNFRQNTIMRTNSFGMQLTWQYRL